MKYFLDTEFHEYSLDKEIHNLDFDCDTIELISIGIVSEEGKEFYAISKDFNISMAWSNEWLRDNVLKQIFEEMLSINSKEKRLEEEYLEIKKISPKGDLEKRFMKLNVFEYNNFYKLLSVYGKTKYEIKELLIKYFNIKIATNQNNEYCLVAPNPQIYAYYADYDWVVFCWIFGRMIDLPSGFGMYCKDLKQIMDEKVKELNEGIKPNEATEITLNRIKSLPEYPKQENEHNALEDAKWNKKLYDFLKAIK